MGAPPVTVSAGPSPVIAVSRNCQSSTVCHAHEPGPTARISIAEPPGVIERPETSDNVQLGHPGELFEPDALARVDVRLGSSSSDIVSERPSHLETWAGAGSCGPHHLDEVAEKSFEEIALTGRPRTAHARIVFAASSPVRSAEASGGGSRKDGGQHDFLTSPHDLELDVRAWRFQVETPAKIRHRLDLSPATRGGYADHQVSRLQPGCRSRSGRGNGDDQRPPEGSGGAVDVQPPVHHLVSQGKPRGNADSEPRGHEFPHLVGRTGLLGAEDAEHGARRVEQYAAWRRNRGDVHVDRVHELRGGRDVGLADLTHCGHERAGVATEAGEHQQLSWRHGFLRDRHGGHIPRDLHHRDPRLVVDAEDLQIVANCPTG